MNQHVETKEYQNRVEQLSTPGDVDPGSYFLIASGNPEFDKSENQISFCEVWVSDLAIILRNHHGNGIVGGLVLSANEGSPIAGARVRAWIHNEQNQ